MVGDDPDRPPKPTVTIYVYVSKIVIEPVKTPPAPPPPDVLSVVNEPPGPPPPTIKY